ncbi:hypothetical protein ACWF94_06165 [Streptomyces sp. NPDC055078]
MPFPEDPLDLRAELEISGQRVDVTGHVYTREPISIAHGTTSRGSQPDPASCSLQLDNQGGIYSPRNPMSPYYGRLGRNAPLRITVPGPESYLSMDGVGTAGAATPDHASLDITGDLDIRVEATPQWVSPVPQLLIGKWQAPSAQSYLLFIQSGRLYLLHSTTGTDVGTYNTFWTLPGLPERAAVRATLDANNGSSGYTVTMYWAPSLAGPWVQFGESSWPGVTSIHAGTAPLAIAPALPPTTPAWPAMSRRVHRAEVRSGIGGTVVAAPDFRSLPPGSSSLTDSTGKVWTLTGAAEITNREFLFYGEVSEWPQRWTPGGHSAWVPIQAAGILRRLGQGRKPIDSTLRRRIPRSGPVAYWPLEDGPATTAPASPVPGVTPMVVTGLTYESDDTLPGSSALPSISAGATVRATVPTYTATGAWHVEMMYRLNAAPGMLNTLLDIYTSSGPWSRFTVRVQTDNVQVTGTSLDGESTTLLLNVNFGPRVAGQWNRLQLIAETVGSQIKLTVLVAPVSGQGGSLSHTYTGTVGVVRRIDTQFGADLDGMAIGHYSVFSESSAFVYNFADHGFTAETATARLQRLTQEEPTVPVTVISGGRDAERMGPQRPATLMDLVAECAASDGGMLYERMDRLGLAYRARATLENQPVALTLDYAAGHVVPPLEPVDDDQATRNDVSVTRAGGATARHPVETGPLSTLPPERGGVGIYDESVTLSLAADAQTEQIAAWLAHLGTWDEARWPTVRVLLHKHPQLISAVLRLRIGDRVRIINLPPESGSGGDPVDLLVQHISHVPRPRAWEMTLVCAPAGPYTVGVLDDPALGRLDTEGSELVAGVSASATSWSVATTAGPRWITTAEAPIAFPFDLLISGERVTVGGISGTSSPQTFTISARSVNGIAKPHSAATSLSLAQPMRLAL